jgi:hypothetical protein
MTRRQLRFLVIPATQLITDRVEQLHIALLRVLGQRSNERLRSVRPVRTLASHDPLTYDIAPVAFPASCVSALCRSACIQALSCRRTHRLRVFTPRPHDHIRRRRLGLLGLLPSAAILVHDFFTKTHDTRHHAAEIAPVTKRVKTERPAGDSPEIAHPRAQQALSGFGEQVGLLDRSLGGVDVRKVKSRPRVAPAYE